MAGDGRFWMLFGAIWLLIGLLFVVASLAALLLVDRAAFDEPALIWVFLGVGLAATVAGGAVVGRARRARARDRRLARSGVPLKATVTAIRRSAITINNQPRWHLRYRYEYTAGQPLEGESRALPAAAVAGLAPGDIVLVKADPRRPADSLFVGRA